MLDHKDFNSGDVTIRLADPPDARTLVRLAALDGARVPDGPLVVADVQGELVAALALDRGQVVADPFERTAPLVEMLELRARQLRGFEAGERGIARALVERLRALGRAPRLRTP